MFNQWWQQPAAGSGAWSTLSESDGDDETFVLEMEGSGTTEVGSGFGITTAASKTFTAAGTVSATSGGYRTLNNGKLDFNASPSEVLAGFLGGATNTWFWGLKMKDVAGDNGNAFFNFIGGQSSTTADAGIYCRKNSSTTLQFTPFANNGSSNPHSAQTIDFNPDSTHYVWLCHWSDGTTIKGGWVSSSTDGDGPTALTDFGTNVFSVSSTTGFADSSGNGYTFHLQSGTGAGIGQNNANAKGKFKLNKFVASTNVTIDNSA